MSDRKPTGTFQFQGLGGKLESRPINFVIDIRDYKGRDGYPWLVIAANPHLSVYVLWLLLFFEGGKNERGESWIKRRRWLFRDPEEVRVGRQANADGKDDRAVNIMRENPTMSARGLVRLLKQHGIHRGKDWVLKHKCD
jgi:hypothetical protein